MTYFVRITPRTSRQRLDGPIHGLDLSEEVLLARVVVPYREGRPVTLAGRTLAAADVAKVKITFAGPSVGGTPLAQLRAQKLGARAIGDYVARHGEDVTDRFIDGPPGTLAEPIGPSHAPGSAAPRQHRDQAPAGKQGPRKRWLSRAYTRSRSALKTPVGFLLAVISVLGAGASILALLTAQGGTAPSPEEQRLLDLIPPKVGWHCRPEATATSMQFTTAIAASAVCTPVDPGPQSLSFELFTTESEMKQVMDLESERAIENGVGCDRDYTTRIQIWVDAAGRADGEMFCSDVRRHIHRSNLTWTDNRTLLMAAASTEPRRELALHRWWQRDVRFDGRGPNRRTASHLAALTPAAMGPCTGLPVLYAGAVALARCAPGQGLEAAAIALFPAPAELDDYFATRTAGKTDLGGESCRDSPLGLSRYPATPQTGRPHGELLCYPDDGREWFEWTDTAAGIYAYASRPARQWRQLYREWGSKLTERPPAS